MTLLANISTRGPFVSIPFQTPPEEPAPIPGPEIPQTPTPQPEPLAPGHEPPPRTDDPGHKESPVLPPAKTPPAPKPGR
jgi:hypothetical protein